MTQILDPLVSLSFTLRACPGVYALLLGSGVSRSANIPTGWEVVLGLISQVAAALAETPVEQPERWYAEKFGKEATYSDLLDTLCRTPIERQQLLKRYFEPTPEEREQKLKLATPAHHAVAELMEAGLVRVVVTTNFDRLLEQALEQRGIVPVVISSPDQAAGMIPLPHQKCCIIKIHGDYLDTRILNTEEELSTYDPAMAALIERVLDEFGLIICGWSATWDLALRASINQAKNRRYSCYWATTSDLSSEALSVAQGRRAEILKIKSADDFFGVLLDRIRGLEEFARPHPLSVQAAVGAAKRYLADDMQRIRLHDLYREAVSEARSAFLGSAFPAHGTPIPNGEMVAQRIRAYDAASATVVALGVTIGRWSRGDQDDLLMDAIAEIGTEPLVGGSQYTVWQNLRPYPATLMLYAAGIASLLSKRPGLFSKLMTVPTPSFSDKDAIAVSKLNSVFLCDNRLLASLFGGQNRKVAMSDWLHKTLRESFQDYISGDADYDLLFDTFEYYYAVAYAGTIAHFNGWVPVGAWAAHRRQNHAKILAGLNGATVHYGGLEFAASCGVFSQNGKSLDENVARVEAHAKSISSWY